MKIMVACRAIDNMAGGVERMAVALMNEMTARGHEVSLLTWDAEKAANFYPMDSRIRWHRLAMGNPGQKATWKLRLQRAGKVREIVEKEQPALIIAFQQGTFFSTRLFTNGLHIPVIAAEREAPQRLDHVDAGRRRFLYFWSFRLAARVTIQCESYRKFYPESLHRKIVTIPNPVFPASASANPGTEDGEKILLCVGRLGYQKNQEALLHAFAPIAAQLPDWSVHLAGDGEDKAKLEELAQSLGISMRVKFLGPVRDVAALYTQSHIFCLPARWEGFPNALAEAMAHGLPSVGYEGCAGVSDLIRHGHTGLLARGNGDVETLKFALLTLMKDPQQRALLGANAKISVAQYAPAAIYDRWEKLFKETATS